MNHHEHAQQIYSLYLLSHFLNKTPVPSGQQLENAALSAISWAQSFAAAAKKQPPK